MADQNNQNQQQWRPQGQYQPQPQQYFTQNHNNPNYESDAKEAGQLNGYQTENTSDFGNESPDDIEMMAIDKAKAEAAAQAGSLDDIDPSDEPFKHLPPHQAKIVKGQVYTVEAKTSYAKLYSFADKKDKLIMAGAFICAIGAGIALPLNNVVLGSLQGAFQDYLRGHTSRAEFNATLVSKVLNYIYLGIGEFVGVYFAMLGFMYTGEHITTQIRSTYLEACMRQNIGFFDAIGSGEITTRIASDTNLIQIGISEKVALTTIAMSCFVSAFIVGFIYYWKLTLILFSTVLALVLTVLLGTKFMFENSRKCLAHYSQGNNLADEVFGSIRTAVAFGTQERLAKQYDMHLVRGEKFGVRYKTWVACLLGGFMSIMYLNYGLAFWQGSTFVINGVISLSHVLTIMMSVMSGAFQLGNVAPNLQALTNAVGAAGKIFNVIERVSPIDASSDEGIKLDRVEGNIRLEGVHHVYPSRPEVHVMKGVSLDIPAGKTTALVGPSGSGKSTIIGLVERFYNPVEGQLFLDGHDISTLNLKWLRRQMSLVSQEPTLFAVSIYENIRFGMLGTAFEKESPEQQRERIINAAKMANAHDFITQLNDGYETNVGDRGFLLSGGQKQRVAIARAVVADPKILLLDEATSALDTKSEGVVQAALDKASEGRTTIVIAHRLSTVKDAENIVVMSAGEIVEQGNHEELIKLGGVYQGLVAAQEMKRIQKEASDKRATLAPEEIEIADRMSRKLEADELDNMLNRLSRMSKSDRKTKALSKFQSGMPVDEAELGEIAAALQKERDSRYKLGSILKMIMVFNRPEWKLMGTALAFTIVCGGGQPTSAVFYAKNVENLSLLTPTNHGQTSHTASFWCLMYLMLGLVTFICYMIQGTLFARCSERLVHRVRHRAFRTLLRQDIAFFDRDENTAGALTAFLATETTYVAGLSGATLATILQVSVTLFGASAVALAVGWKLSLVCIATIPLLLVTGYYRFQLLTNFERRSRRAYAESASYATEAVSAIRTVHALGREESIITQYKDSLAAQRKRSLRSLVKSTVFYAISQSLMFFIFGLAFWWGGTLIGDREYNMFQFFLCLLAVVYGAQSAGGVFSFAPDMGKAVASCQELMMLFDRQPHIDTWANHGEALPTMEGTVEFKNVHFRYPTRPEQPILRGLNLKIQPGQYVALVGASGCGKSTTIALLERFYDPIAGTVMVDGKDISAMNINDYRSHIALVSQEPTLYQGTIKENILLGSAREDVSDEDIAHVCKEANIYDYIMSLPNGFDTMCGSKGALLSGGQKQRIAIARALIRNPRILLLDEATSALDSESERVVQACLDAAAKGRTTIAVAHRLSTIQKADIIYVFDQGKIVEAGNHEKLMGLNGRYAELVNLQTLDKEGQ